MWPEEVIVFLEAEVTADNHMGAENHTQLLCVREGTVETTELDHPIGRKENVCGKTN